MKARGQVNLWQVVNQFFSRAVFSHLEAKGLRVMVVSRGPTQFRAGRTGFCSFAAGKLCQLFSFAALFAYS